MSIQSIAVGMILLGVVLLVGGKFLPWIGRLPGDVTLHGRNWQFNLPIGTCLLVSIALSVVMWLFGRK
jgi:membrane protein implicated in regulation of membrane protease activity